MNGYFEMKIVFHYFIW